MSNDSFYRLVRFGINGFIMTICAYILTKILIILGIGYIISSTLSYIMMIFVNYLTSSRFVFKEKKSFKKFFHFLVAQGISFLLFSTTNYLLYISGLQKDYCFFIAIILSTTMNFLYNNFITFKK